MSVATAPNERTTAAGYRLAARLAPVADRSDDAARTCSALHRAAEQYARLAGALRATSAGDDAWGALHRRLSGLERRMRELVADLPGELTVAFDWRAGRATLHLCPECRVVIA